MCLICIEIEKGEISPSEFANKIESALKENPKHGEELINALSKANEKYLDQLDKYLSEQIVKDMVNLSIVK